MWLRSHQLVGVQVCWKHEEPLWQVQGDPQKFDLPADPWAVAEKLPVEVSDDWVWLAKQGHSLLQMSLGFHSEGVHVRFYSSIWPSYYFPSGRRFKEYWREVWSEDVLKYYDERVMRRRGIKREGDTWYWAQGIISVHDEIPRGGDALDYQDAPLEHLLTHRYLGYTAEGYFSALNEFSAVMPHETEDFWEQTAKFPALFLLTCKYPIDGRYVSINEAIFNFSQNPTAASRIEACRSRWFQVHEPHERYTTTCDLDLKTLRYLRRIQSEHGLGELAAAIYVVAEAILQQWTEQGFVNSRVLYAYYSREAYSKFRALQLYKTEIYAEI